MLRLFSILYRWCKRHQKGIKGTLIRKMCSKVDSIVFCALLWDWSYHLLKKLFQHNPLKGIIEMLWFYCSIPIKTYHDLTWILHNMYYPNWITNYTYHNSSLIYRPIFSYQNISVYLNKNITLQWANKLGNMRNIKMKHENGCKIFYLFWKFFYPLKESLNGLTVIGSCLAQILAVHS